MAVTVVDDSALAAVLFGEPEAEAVARQLAWRALSAPLLLEFELANVCLVKARRAPEQSEALRAAFRLRKRLAIEEHAVDQDGVLEIASETGLTANDASYLWLTKHLGAELVTLDRQLGRVASALIQQR